MMFQLKNGIKICLTQPLEIVEENQIIISAYYNNEPMSTSDIVVSPESLIKKLNELSEYDPYAIDVIFD